MPDKTHREVKDPRITVRFLADFMAATMTGQRSIIRGCKYPPIARLVQHDEAKGIVSKFIRGGSGDVAPLGERATQIKNRLADDDFTRDLYDHNADYIARYAKVHSVLELPKAEILLPGQTPPIVINGVKVTPELHMRFQRLTKTNETRTGGGMLRYSKGKALSPEVGAWQSAILLGYLTDTNIDPTRAPGRQALHNNRRLQRGSPSCPDECQEPLQSSDVGLPDDQRVVAEHCQATGSRYLGTYSKRPTTTPRVVSQFEICVHEAWLGILTASRAILPIRQMTGEPGLSPAIAYPTDTTSNILSVLQSRPESWPTAFYPQSMSRCGY